MKKRLLFFVIALALMLTLMPLSAFAQQKDEYAVVANKKVGDCAFDLITHDSDGNRLVRITGTNLGDLISDAFRHGMDADIAYFNGGGIRSHIESGEITYNDLLNVLPFNNTGVVVEVSGKTVIEMLEVAVAKWPEESGSFPHVSGMTFSVNVLGGTNERVYNVQIENPETGMYEALDPDKTYTVAANNYILLECGDGMSMFEGAKVISDTGVLDVELLEAYIKDDLGGVIGEDYMRSDRRVTFTEGVVFGAVDDGDHAIWIAAIGIVLAITTIVTVSIIRKRRG